MGYSALQGRNPYNIWFIFWEKQWLHKFILKFTDLYTQDRAKSPKLKQNIAGSKKFFSFVKRIFCEMATVCLLFSQLCSSRLKLELSYRSKLLVIHSLHASQLYDDDVAVVVLVYLINDREFINVWYGSKCCRCSSSLPKKRQRIHKCTLGFLNS